MKTDFKFSNLLGTVYSQGNLLFDPDGTCLFSPVGNRVTIFDLVNNKTHTLPFAHRKNITRIDLTPRGNLLLSVDEDGRAILTNIPRRIALHRFSFRGTVTALAFSPSGRHFAVGIGNFVEVWLTPATPDQDSEGKLDFAPFVRHHIHAGHYDTVQSIHWSSDSRFFLSAAKDLTARIWSLDKEEGFVPTTLSGHREGVIAAYFSQDQEKLYTISKDGAVFNWAFLPDVSSTKKSLDDEDIDNATENNSRWRIKQRHYFMENNTKVKCSAFHSSSNLLVAGFSNGVFGLYEMPDFNKIHSLSISQNDIDFVTINKTGEWLAFGSSKLGQLLVWEWQSESYILKQQGHFDSINSLVYSPDSKRIITTADDGKIKVWDVKTGFCIVTFTEHSSGVTACEFSNKGNVLFTSSLDGSIRAWDLIRYRNFRTFTAANRLSFSCLAVDPSGEVVCAGSIDSFDIYVWSVQNGQLLDRLSGHEGPVSSLSFAPSGGTVVSGSWDHTVRVWSIFGRTQTSESLQLQADVLDVAFRPDSKQIAVSTLDGQITFWAVSEARQETGIDGRRDVSGGRKITDRRTAANASGTKSFTVIRYSVDGTCLLAGGNSKYICLYSVECLVLLKKFTVSVNLSLSGTQEFLNSKLMTEAGPLGLIDEQGNASELEDRIDNTLPGSKRGGDPTARKRMPEIRVSGLAFAPNGEAFCAASTEGLLIYSLETTFIFDPIDLDVTITPQSIMHTLDIEKDYLKSLIMSFRLNESSLIRRVFERIPHSTISLIVKELPLVYLSRLLKFVGMQTEESPHLEFCLLWLEAILASHGSWIRENRGAMESEIRIVSSAVSKIREEMRKLADENCFLIDYLLSQPKGCADSDSKESNDEWAIFSSNNNISDTLMGDGNSPEWIGLD
ncbi:Periodic tryptophan protein 2 [Erysiphe necator]|uniref:Putative periodic tryptophan protein 2 n=1 Tax=Uncinula necator TaxID=52586 RepID=A0A0B1P837_UNCNE|nr:Periodic tryptophan protein 2 [Erysiphe necator]KHJ34423.1 putative periodic tryptophan protein 2 [Erysiphe necator]